MKTDNHASKLLDNDFNLISVQIKKFIESLEKENSRENINNQTLFLSINQNLIEILKSALLSNAKRIRPLFCFWIIRNFMEFKKKPTSLLNDVYKIALSIEIIHNASLIIDDIEDGSKERRNKVALHVKYGLSNALNAASWMYFLAINHLPLSLQSLASEALIDCHVGQAIDLSSTQKGFSEKIFWASKNERWEFYERCVAFKTTRLIQLSLQLIVKLLKIKKNDYKFIEEIIFRYGIIYQIFDDLKNVFPELSGSKLYEDLKTGFRSAISLTFLELLTDAEKSECFPKIENETFFEYMITHQSLHHAIQICFEKAESLLNETSLFIDKVIGKKNHLRLYLAELFELPFLEVKQHVSAKIKNGFIP